MTNGSSSKQRVSRFEVIFILFVKHYLFISSVASNVSSLMESQTSKTDTNIRARE